MSPGSHQPESVADVTAALTANGYLPDEGLATAIFLTMTLQRPLLLEGEAGVGKTEVAKVLAAWTRGELIRLQCYEGIDAAQAVYDWDYARQLLHLRAAEISGEAHGRTSDDLEADLYQQRFLIRRAVLRSIEPGAAVPPVLLIDEIDRADDEFEAFLLEVLSDWQITVPEIGVFRTDTPPLVVLTSNRTRDVHDALKRRCLYHWVEHPSFEREVAIVHLRLPDVSSVLARQVAAAVEGLRDLNLYKPPGVAETIDWAAALARLGVSELDEQSVATTLGAVLKYREDHERVAQHGFADIVKQAVGSPTGPAMSQTPGSPAAGRLSVCFANVLRGLGVETPVSAVVSFTEALGAVGIGQRDDVYWAGRATLVRRPEDIAAYDRAFAAFFESTFIAVEAAPENESVTLAVDSDDGATAGEREPERDTVELRYSIAEVLRHRDFADYSADELAEARRWMSTLRVTGSPRRSLRLTPTRERTRRPDLRRTVRAAVRTRGDPVERHFRRPATRYRRIVVLLDISGSMEPYARALLRFVQAAVAGRRRVEAFTLGTRLTRVTRELSSHDPDLAVARATGAVEDWSGGTRLGDGLEAFNREWGVRGLARGADVVILSDGWDRGDPNELAEQMGRLSRVAHRLIWVNPLKVSPGYAPLARGMAAALPYVDEFVEGHSLDALERLVGVLNGGQKRRA